MLKIAFWNKLLLNDTGWECIYYDVQYVADVAIGEAAGS